MKRIILFLFLSACVISAQTSTFTYTLSKKVGVNRVYITGANVIISPQGGAFATDSIKLTETKNGYYEAYNVATGEYKIFVRQDGGAISANSDTTTYLFEQRRYFAGSELDGALETKLSVDSLRTGGSVYNLGTFENKLTNGVITDTSAYTDATISGQRLKNETLGSNKIKNGSVAQADVATGAITLTKMDKALIEARAIPISGNDTIDLTSYSFGAAPKLIYCSWTVNVVSISASSAVITPIAGYGTTYTLLFAEN